MDQHQHQPGRQDVVKPPRSANSRIRRPIDVMTDSTHDAGVTRIRRSAPPHTDTTGYASTPVTGIADVTCAPQDPTPGTARHREGDVTTPWTPPQDECRHKSTGINRHPVHQREEESHRRLRHSHHRSTRDPSSGTSLVEAGECDDEDDTPRGGRDRTCGKTNNS